jgi:hypothetical protein
MAKINLIPISMGEKMQQVSVKETARMQENL